MPKANSKGIHYLVRFREQIRFCWSSIVLGSRSVYIARREPLDKTGAISVMH